MQDKKVQAVFGMLGLEIWDLRAFFDMLEITTKRNNRVVRIRIDHFVLLCLRLGGKAKKADLSALKYEIECMHDEVRGILAAMEVLRDHQDFSSPATDVQRNLPNTYGAPGVN